MYHTEEPPLWPGEIHIPCNRPCRKCGCKLIPGDNITLRQAKAYDYLCRPCSYKDTPSREKNIDRYRERRLLRGAKVRAKLRGLEFSLTLDHIQIPTHCPVLGIPLTRNGSLRGTPTVDRIDSSRGYTPDNIAIISHRANTMKMDATPEEIMRLAVWAASQKKNSGE